MADVAGVRRAETHLALGFVLTGVLAAVQLIDLVE